MIQITEDTPPDMLSGAMDLTVHLPDGQFIKMAVQRSTPMMDLLVQITTNHHLQLSNYILKALDMATSSDHEENFLPYKPSTPIGALNTQHIKVVPKARNSNSNTINNTNVPKSLIPGQQPFESTFRLKIHLPRNQLYVTRVSKNVLLEDIMRKVCEEKNLDVNKYEFKHPANLDTVLDPKLTLSDYQITEIYLVTKGTFTQSFSSNDIMALRKEEERKQMHSKTGGGVFNLIFRRSAGDTANTTANKIGSGSLSSETRSISPAHSDDSRSVTPPTKEPPIQEHPKPPQRKRRPAPKPPSSQPDQQIPNTNVNMPVSSPSVAVVSNIKEANNNNCLTICHSRNSSDSSGYHEAASILSDHCNTSLPRPRPKSMAFLNSQSSGSNGSSQHLNRLSRGESQEKLNRFSSMSNLTQATKHSKSTSSLVPPGRKKKAAPPPPPPKAETQIKSSTSFSAGQSSSESVTTDSSATITPTPTVVASPIVARVASQNITESKKIESTSPPASAISINSDQESYNASIVSTLPQLEETPKIINNEKYDGPIKTEFVVDSKENNSTIGKDKTVDNTEQQKTFEVDVIKSNSESNQITIFPKESDTITSTHSILKNCEQVVTENIVESKPSETSEPLEKSLSESKTLESNCEIDWQYQLPSPPKAFKDSSPLNELQDHFEKGTKDSIVTSPELFEKLKELEKENSSSVDKEESDPNILSKLSLENLEKRKSLVYNRELATSLKVSDADTQFETEMNSDVDKCNDFDSSISKFEMTFNEVRNTNFVKNKTSTLPNFKITTYDNPKQGIKVFEDESIRSSENSQNRRKETLLHKVDFGRSMENVSRTYTSNESDYYFYKPPVNPSNVLPSTNISVTRSGSFIHENNQLSYSMEEKRKFPIKPVVRSKSSLTMNRTTSNQIKMQSIDRQNYYTQMSNLGKSNSSFDVSGLQSLEVMKLIQTKLSTPTSSMENINQSFTSSPSNEKVNRQTATSKSENSPQSQNASINTGTWSDRRSQIVPSHIRESNDLNSSKLLVKTVNNGLINSNNYEVKNIKSNGNTENKGGGGKIKIENNDITPLQNQVVGTNVVIKIGQNHNDCNVSQNYINADNSKNKIETITPDYKSFITHTTASGYRKPFTDVNKNNQNNFDNVNYKESNRRPHSIALDNNIDISRVPIVRAVELKKPYRDLPKYNSSITQILGIPLGNDVDKEINCNSTSSSMFSTSDNSTLNNKWIMGPSSYSTLPNKNFSSNNNTVNKDVPFSQSNLRRTESSKLLRNDSNIHSKNAVDIKMRSINIENNNKRKNDNNLITTNKNNNIQEIINIDPKSINNNKDNIKVNHKKITAMSTPPPPPPIVINSNSNKKQSKITNQNEDPREALLSAIRNFGGKKGLKAVNN